MRKLIASLKSRSAKDDNPRGELTEGPEIIVVVMGVTGSGKSQLINTITKGNDAVVGKGLVSQTKDIQVIEWHHKGHLFKFIDTPGFDDTYLSDAQMLKKISNFLATMYSRQVRVNCVLYLHRISDVRMSGSAMKNLKLFQDLCGEEGLKNVLLVTTFWDEVVLATAKMREKELNESPEFWKVMIDHGSEVIRHDRRSAASHQLIDRILSHQKTVLQIQRELVERKLALAETEAGKTISSQLVSQKAKFEEQLKNLQDELRIVSKETLADLAFTKLLSEGIQQLLDQLASLEDDQHSLAQFHFGGDP